MEGDENIPMLLRFYFGEAAEAARGGASERLLGWCRAYDEWLGERKRSYRPDTVKQSVMAWRRLAQQSGKMPWELTAGGYRAARGLDEGGGVLTGDDRLRAGDLLEFLPVVRRTTGRPGMPGGLQPGGEGEAAESAALRGSEAAEPKGGDPAAEDDGAGPVGAGQAGLRFHAGAAAAGGAAGKAETIEMGADRARHGGGVGEMARRRRRSGSACRPRCGRRSGRRWKRAGDWRGCGRETISSCRWSTRSRRIRAAERRTGRRGSACRPGRSYRA